MWFGLGGFLLAVGATLRWLVTVPVVAIGPDRLGLAMMIAGAASLAYGVIARLRRRNLPGPPATQPTN